MANLKDLYDLLSANNPKFSKMHRELSERNRFYREQRKRHYQNEGFDETEAELKAWDDYMYPKKEPK